MYKNLKKTNLIFLLIVILLLPNANGTEDDCIDTYTLINVEKI